MSEVSVSGETSEEEVVVYGLKGQLRRHPTEPQHPTERPNLNRRLRDSPASGSQRPIPTLGEDTVDAAADIGATTDYAHQGGKQRHRQHDIPQALEGALEVKKLDEQRLELAVCRWDVAQEIGRGLCALGGRDEGSGTRCGEGSVHTLRACYREECA
ncbi:hypothetical protein VSDG_03356 [Cytospora chrysosperma]|uniref:Uncharacterized protein n=1 Tax=Cytospora chrysosperma TaxID=252740 RepID=A0A423WB32_CYTCH|nr:hypothetical protein VSDG_03356 [Valsa sordida]